MSCPPSQGHHKAGARLNILWSFLSRVLFSQNVHFSAYLWRRILGFNRNSSTRNFVRVDRVKRCLRASGGEGSLVLFSIAVIYVAMLINDERSCYFRTSAGTYRGCHVGGTRVLISTSQMKCRDGGRDIMWQNLVGERLNRSL